MTKKKRIIVSLVDSDYRALAALKCLWQCSYSDVVHRIIINRMDYDYLQDVYNRLVDK